MRVWLVLVIAAVGCSADDAQPKAAKPLPAAASNPATDPCVTVRADYYWQEQRWLLLSAGAGSGAINPAAMAMLARYKLDHPTCFF